MVSKSDSCDGLEDLVLAARIKEGDRRAFDCLYHRYSENLLAFLGGKGVQRSDAEDILQDVWIKFHRDPPTGDASHVKRWLFRVADTTRIDWIRTPVKKKESQFIDGEAEQVTSSSSTSPDEIKELQLTFLPDCLQALPKELSQIVVGRMRGDKHEEIAKSLNIAIGTSHSGYNRGQEKLKDCIEKKLREKKEQ